MLGFILKLLKPFQLFLQRLGYIESDFTSEHIKMLMSQIRAGDILLSYESGRFTSIFIKGEWDHAAIVTDVRDVIEAVGDKFDKGVNLGGVREIPLDEWLWKKTEIMILRYKDNYSAARASVECKKYKGQNYDYSFTYDNNKLYCSELVYLSFKPFTKNFMEHVSDEKRVLPIDYVNDPSLKVVYNSRVSIDSFLV